MAEGRMIVTKIGRDPRIASLSRTARMIWAFILPHTDSKGTVPRDACELRLTCFPAWNDVTNNEVESSILEFFVPKPAIALETIIRGEKRIQLCEFEMCNWNLEFMKKKRWREEKAKSPGPSGTVVDCPSRSEVKGSEVKRRENNFLYIASFEPFWKAYPRKEGRKPALEAWLKLRPEAETVTLLLQALLKYKDSAAVRDGCIMAPARWLTEERWTDEIKEDGSGDPIYA